MISWLYTQQKVVENSSTLKHQLNINTQGWHKNCQIEVWLCLQIQSYQCIISTELFLNLLSYFVVLFLSQALQGLQTLKQHYFFLSETHTVWLMNLVGLKKIQTKSIASVFSFCQLCPKLFIQSGHICGIPSWPWSKFQVVNNEQINWIVELL